MTQKIASVIMAAGRGSRMKGYKGSKALLPLGPHSIHLRRHQAHSITIDNLPGLIITMGDVPFVKKKIYRRLADCLAECDRAVLEFEPRNKKQYGVLEMQGDRVLRITEWKYWKDYPEKRRAALAVCNSGIYAARKEILEKYIPVLASRPQTVHKELDGRLTAVKEYFITDLVELMTGDIDALQKAQALNAATRTIL